MPKNCQDKGSTRRGRNNNNSFAGRNNDRRRTAKNPRPCSRGRGENKWGTLSYGSQRYRNDYNQGRYSSQYMEKDHRTSNTFRPTTPGSYIWNNRDEHPDANESHIANESRNSNEFTSLPIPSSSINDSFRQYSESNYGSTEIPSELSKTNEVDQANNKSSLLPQAGGTGSHAQNSNEVSIAVAENVLIHNIKEEKVIEAAAKANEKVNENSSNLQAKANIKNNEQLLSVTEKQKAAAVEDVPKSTKKKKKRRKSSEDVVCLGQIKQFENLVDDCSNDYENAEQPSEKTCLICGEKGHTSFQCQMICKNCSAAYHNTKTCPKPINMSLMFQKFMEFCMQQCCQYNPEYKFQIGDNVNALIQPTSEKKIKGNRKKVQRNSSNSNDSESDSSSEVQISKKRKKRNKKSESEIEQNPHFPAFNSPFAQTLPFTAFSGHAAAAYNPMMAFSQMLPGAYNPATVAALNFKR